MRAGCLLLLVLGSASARAAEIVVPTQQNPTVDSALSASQKGDVILVDAAQYVGESGELRIEHELTIRGINGKPALPPVRVEQTTAHLEDLVLSGQSLSESLTFAELLDVVLATLSFSGGNYALRADDSVVVLEGVEVQSAGSAGVQATDTDLTATDCTATGFKNFRVFFSDGGSLSLNGGAYTDNERGVVLGVDADVAVEGTTFANNRATDGPDLHVDGATAVVTVTGATFSSGVATSKGGSIYAKDLTLTVSASAFSGAAASSFGGALHYETSTQASSTRVQVLDTTFTKTSASTGGAISVAGGWIDLSGVTIEEGLANLGGGIAIDDGRLVSEDLVATSTRALSGGAVYAVDSLVTLTGLVQRTAVTDLAGVHGSGVYVSGSTLLASDLDLADLHADKGWLYAQGGFVTVSGVLASGLSANHGAFAYTDHANVVLTDVYADGGTATTGGVLYSVGGNVVVQDGDFRNHTVADAVLFASAPSQLRVERSRFCSNAGSGAATAVHIADGSERDGLRNNVFQENTASTSGSIVLVSLDPSASTASSDRVSVHFNDFVDNKGGLADLVSSSGRIDVRNTIWKGDNPALLSTGDRASATGGYSLIDGANSPLFPTDLLGDPLFQGYTPGDCDSVFWLLPRSPARDAGDPAMFDVDGSRSDIGAFGGPLSGLLDGDGDHSSDDVDCDDGDASIHPGAEDVPFDGIDQDCSGADDQDGDGDGFDASADCDDTSDTVFPDAVEVPYDGIDQDCTGGDLIDVDSDGYASVQVGGTDCDDDKPRVHPTATEIWYDGVDQNCDGNDGDQDLDGYLALHVGGADCDDEDDGVHPGMWDDYRDQIDQDCDGYLDSAQVGGTGNRGCDAGGVSVGAWWLFLLATVRRRREA